MLRMCVYMHSRFIENHPIRILEDGPLISEGVLSQPLQHIGDQVLSKGVLLTERQTLVHVPLGLIWCCMVGATTHKFWGALDQDVAGDGLGPHDQVLEINSNKKKTQGRSK
jgi:hypothetical protein